MQLTCPCCHAHVPLEAALLDEAGRELVGMLAAMQPELALPLVHYLGFFRPAKQQLGWGRSLRLAREVLGVMPLAPMLLAGLLEVNRSLDETRALGGWKPLGNHNYLKRVLDSVQGRQEGAVSLVEPGQAAPRSAAPASRGGQALANLDALKR